MSEQSGEGWPIYELWVKYEDIAMHFNDLLIRLRTQALAAVAALITLIGIFARGDANTKTNWEMVAFALAIIIVLWIALWILDFTYYNRLLLGAVTALFSLEEQSKRGLHVRTIEMSTKIREAVDNRKSWESDNWNLIRGRWLFYLLVLFALVGAFAFAFWQICTA